MFWTISNSFVSLAVLSMGSLYMVRLWNPWWWVGGGTRAGRAGCCGMLSSCHSGLPHPLPDPAPCTLSAFPPQNFHCITTTPPPTTISQLHAWFADSGFLLPPPPAPCGGNQSPGPWMPAFH